MLDIIKKQITEMCSDPKILAKRVLLSIAFSAFIYIYPTLIAVSYLYHQNLYSYSFFEVYAHTKYIGYTTLILSLLASFVISFSFPIVIYNYKENREKGLGKSKSFFKSLWLNSFLLIINLLFISMFVFFATVGFSPETFKKIVMLSIMSLSICITFYGIMRLSSKTYLTFTSITLIIYLYIALTSPEVIFTGTLKGFGLGNIPIEIVSPERLPFSNNGTMVLRSPTEIFYRPNDSEHVHIIQISDDLIIKQEIIKIGSQ